MNNFNTVIAPKGCPKYYLTEGKEYEVLKLDIRPEYTAFEIINDVGTISGCNLQKCCHLDGLDWIIKEEPQTNQVDQEIQLLESFMQKFFAKINDHIFNDTIHIDYVHEAIAEFIEEELLTKVKK